MSALYEVASDPKGAFEFCSRFFPLDHSKQMRGIVNKRGGRIIAACIFMDFTGNNCFVHLAGEPGKRWMTRDFLRECLWYPFHTCGLGRITAWVEANNMASRSFCENMGYVPEATLRGAGRNGIDVILYTLFRENCRHV